MRQLVEYGQDDHPETDAERPRVAWSVTVSDGCEGCGDGSARVVLELEPVGAAGTGLSAHLAPETASAVVSALLRALASMGAPPPAG